MTREIVSKCKSEIWLNDWKICAQHTYHIKVSACHDPDYVNIILI